MKTLTIQPPSEKQKLFLRARTKHIAFGGARGGGKSWSVRTKAKLLALKYPGIKILIVRRTYPELINNHINILRVELLEIAKYNDKDKVLKFGNGSTINFTYCAKDGDLDRLQGVEETVSARDIVGTVANDGQGNYVLHFQLRKETAKLNPEHWIGR